MAGARQLRGERRSFISATQGRLLQSGVGMSPRRKLGLAVLGFGVIAGVLVACGDSTPSYPNIQFVSNDSCSSAQSPGASQSPYYGLPPVNGDHIVGQAINELPHFHILPPATVSYNHNPPTSGCHYSIASQAPVLPGAYPSNAVIPPEYWVHNLEHGYIVVLYNCPQGCDSDFQKLVAWRKTLPPDPAANGAIPYAKVVILPWPSMDKKFAAVSWDYYEGFDSLDITKIQDFYDNHVGHSPEGAMVG